MCEPEGETRTFKCPIKAAPTFVVFFILLTPSVNTYGIHEEAFISKGSPTNLGSSRNDPSLMKSQLQFFKTKMN